MNITGGMMRMLFPLVMALASSFAQAQSLYSEGTYQPLVSDRKAFRSGDVLTVLILETASATASADTTTSKTAGIGGTAKSPAIDKTASLGLHEDFSGKGRIQRSGRLLGTITVTVQSVDGQGNMAVKGEQLIAINGEKQEIKLEGRVRPIDILDNNTIQSTRIADAKISYIGNGVLGERQQQGIISRLFSILGLL